MCFAVLLVFDVLCRRVFVVLLFVVTLVFRCCFLGVSMCLFDVLFVLAVVGMCVALFP